MITKCKFLGEHFFNALSKHQLTLFLFGCFNIGQNPHKKYIIHNTNIIFKQFVTLSLKTTKKILHSKVLFVDRSEEQLHMNSYHSPQKEPIEKRGWFIINMQNTIMHLALHLQKKKERERLNVHRYSNSNSCSFSKIQNALQCKNITKFSKISINLYIKENNRRSMYFFNYCNPSHHA